jgi:hypothetical protein
MQRITILILNSENYLLDHRSIHARWLVVRYQRFCVHVHGTPQRPTTHAPGVLEEISTPQRYTVGGKAGDDGFVTRSGLEEI